MTSEKHGIKSLQNESAMEQAIWRHFNNRQFKQAVALCNRMNASYPDFQSGWRTASHLASRLNDPVLALQAIDKAVALDADEPECLLQKANCLIRLNRLTQASEVAWALADRVLLTAYQCATLAMVFQQLGNNEQALPHYQRACELEPKNSGHHYNLATVYRFLGKLDRAELHLNRTIKFNPDDADAYHLRSGLRKQTSDANHVPELKNLVERFKDNNAAKTKVCYALAKELEDMGVFAESFEYLRKGADIRRTSMHYTPESDLSTIQQIQHVYQSGCFNGSHKGHDSEEPIFILGMPRTGTTLVERIIGGHSSVFAAGELNNFATEMTRHAKNRLQGQILSRDELVEYSASLDFREIGRAYIHSTRPFTGHTDRFIDKLPFNYLYIGLIHLALPRARIIHLRRHPLDTCFAVYKTLFKAAYPFSYQLEELGQYYLAYHRLMEHWERVLPGVIHHVQYEHLVKDPEKESRKLFAYCGLSWEDDCLKFYQNQQTSTTASASQIREPVYDSSVGKWRHYAEQLQLLTDLFRHAGLELGE